MDPRAQTKRKDRCWSYLDREEGTGLIIEIDSNAWAGLKIIPKDPNIKKKKIENYYEGFWNRTKYDFY